MSANARLLTAAPTALRLKPQNLALLEQAIDRGFLLGPEGLDRTTWNRLFRHWLAYCWKQRNPCTAVACRLMRKHAILWWSIPAGLRLPPHLTPLFLAMVKSGLLATGNRLYSAEQCGPCYNWADAVRLADAELLAHSVADYLIEHVELTEDHPVRLE